MPVIRDEDIRRILEQSKTIAVVGYSNKPDRASNEVAHALECFGYEIYPVNPTLNSTPERRIYASLADVPVPIDIVDVFRRAEDVPPVVEAAIAVKAKVVWMQLGIVNEEAARRAEEAGLIVVMDRCLKVDHMQLMRT
ncbi:MAG: CoA-binding protein [Anaerolineae bacterium]|nr:CoA-binding protein [Anaerolineae bacterium]